MDEFFGNDLKFSRECAADPEAGSFRVGGGGGGGCSQLVLSNSGPAGTKDIWDKRNVHQHASRSCELIISQSPPLVKGRAHRWLKGSPVPFCSLPCALPVGTDTQQVGMRVSSCHHQHHQPYLCTSGLSTSPAGVPQATSTGLKETGTKGEASCIHATCPEGTPAGRPRTRGRLGVRTV